MPDNKYRKMKITDGLTLFFYIIMIGLLFAIVCCIFCQVGIKIGEGRTADMRKIIEEQNEKMDQLEDMVQNVDKNVAVVKNNIKRMKSKIEILTSDTLEKENNKKSTGETTANNTENEAEAEPGQ